MLGNHTFESRQPVAALKKIGDKMPVHQRICPNTNPLPTAIWRGEELLSAK